MKTVLLPVVFASAAAFARIDRTMPFDLPLGAVVDVECAGWDVSGRIPVSMSHARLQFASRLSRAGWVNMHSIEVTRDRTVEAWSLGRRTLTLMLWRIDSGCCGFSCGFGGDNFEGGDK